MSRGITIDKEHGLNPSIVKCFWCKGDKGVAFNGHIKGGGAAPKYVITDYEPCDKCAEVFSKGIRLIGVTESPVAANMMPICEQPDGKCFYPTGNSILVQENFIRRFLSDEPEEFIEQVITKKALIMPDKVVLDFIQQAKNIQEQED